MAVVYNEKYRYTDHPYYLFISNRFLRIYPLYLLIILLVALLSVCYGFLLGDWAKFKYYADWYAASPQSLKTLCIVFISNLTLIGQDIITFFGIDKTTGSFSFLGLNSSPVLSELLFIPIAWTVAVEFCFYLVSPLFLTRSIKIVLFAIAIALLIRWVCYWIDPSYQGFMIYRFAPTEICWFILGTLSYKLYKKGWLFKADIGGVLISVLISLLFCYPYLPEGIRDMLIYGGVFMFSPAIFYRFSKNQVDRFLGNLCYPMYLGHALFLLIVMANRFPKPFGSGLPLLVITIGFSIAVNYLFLDPFEKYRQKRVHLTESMRQNKLHAFPVNPILNEQNPD